MSDYDNFPAGQDHDESDGDLGGTYLAPTAKVRLPEHVTKLRKRSRRTDRDGESDRDEGEQ
jgi:hypothetical protein